MMNLSIDYNKTPLLVIWEVTRACALACRHCRADALCERNPEELSTKEGKALLEDIADMGTPLVVFTGGDPLQRDDLEELIGYAKSRGLRVGAIPASTPRLTLERVQGLKNTGLDQMALSLDGATSLQHDGFRGETGSFDLVMSGAIWAHEALLPLQINTVLADWNMEQFDALADLVESLNIVFWEVFFLVPTGRGKVLENCTAEQYESLFSRLYERSLRVPFTIKVTEGPHYRRYVAQQNGELRGKNNSPGALTASYPGINAGKGFCFVDHIGNVYPSGFLPIETGQVRNTSIAKIYRENPLFIELRNTELLKGKCGVCEFKDICGGSRARAYAMTGDYLAEEPFCVFNPMGV